MHRSWWAAPALVAAWVVSPAPAGDFRDLFNGKDLTGWVVEGRKDYTDGDQVKPNWTVQDGLLTCAGKGFGFLRYDDQEYADFLFHVEYRMTPRCNSGIGIRTRPFDPSKSQATRPSYYSYEIQLLDDAGRPPTPHSSGSLYRYVAPTANAVQPAPEWNTVEIECRGPHFQVRINGRKVLDADQSTIPELKNKPLKGYVCLQSHTGKIEFRNIRIQELKATPDK
jgi:hypothetical protein